MRRLFLMMPLLVFVIKPSGADVAIADNGQIMPIVVETAAPACEIFAAEQLKAYLQKITGLEPCIKSAGETLPEEAIVVGHDAAVLRAAGIALFDCAALGEDGFRLITKGRHIFIIGGASRGAIYGVYAFLEKYLGCRFFTSDFEVVPESDNLAIAEGVDFISVPAFALREAYWYDTFDPIFSLKLGFNSDMFGKRKFKTEHGGWRARFCKSLSPVHTFYSLLPPATYYTDHPEYFGLHDGKRLATSGQLCLSNPEVIMLVTVNLLARIKDDPGATYYPVSQNDNQNYCECAHCAAIDAEEGSHAGQLIRFVNAIAERVEKEYPDAKIITFAYQWSQSPAKTKPRDNVVVELTTFACDRSWGIASSKYPMSESFMRELPKWNDLAKELYVWDYTTNYKNYLMLFPNFTAIQENLKLFRDSGIVNLFEQGNYQGKGGYFDEMRIWLLGKWMWNPDQDLNELVLEFMQGYYGAAWPYIWAYFNQLEFLQRNYSMSGECPLTMYQNTVQGCFSREFFETTSQLLSEAEASVKEDEQATRHIRQLALSFWYTYAMLEQFNRELTFVTGGEDKSAEIRKVNKEILNRIEQVGAVRISEIWTTLAGYIVERKARLRSAHEPSVPLVTGCSGTIEDSGFSLGYEGIRCERVCDPCAADGSAVEIYSGFTNVNCLYYLNKVEFNPKKRYRVRVRARLMGKTVMVGPMFVVKVRNTEKSVNLASLSVDAKDLDEMYREYEMTASWLPQADLCVWIAACGQNADQQDKISNKIMVDHISLVEIED